MRLGALSQCWLRSRLAALRMHSCSYEHFYVVYCKFWELDSDHDFSLDKNDLARYNNCALTYQIVERIFAEVGKPGGPHAVESALSRSAGTALVEVRHAFVAA